MSVNFLLNQGALNQNVKLIDTKNISSFFRSKNSIVPPKYCPVRPTFFTEKYNVMVVGFGLFWLIDLVSILDSIIYFSNDSVTNFLFSKIGKLM